MTTATYPHDLSQSESLVTLEAADSHLGRTLHGADWTSRVSFLLSEPTDPDPDAPQVVDMTARRPDDMAALRDASTALHRIIWRTGKPPQGTIPDDIQRATSLLAAHLINKSRQPFDAEVFSSSRIGETSASFRAPSRDDLPRHVRTLIEGYLAGSATWSPIRP